MKCLYCLRDGILRDEENQIFVCDGCWFLLQKPITALPLIRSHLTQKLSGKIPKKELEKSINKFMELISKFKPKQLD